MKNAKDILDRAQNNDEALELAEEQRTLMITLRQRQTFDNILALHATNSLTS